MSLSILLRCTDIDETRNFYRDVLGFAVEDTAEGTLTVEAFGGRLIFTAADLWGTAPTLSGTVYFTVADVDAVFAGIGPKATLAWPLQDVPYGSREFGLRDCNGYHLAFRQAT